MPCRILGTRGNPLGEFEMIADVEEFDRIWVIAREFKECVRARRNHPAAELDGLGDGPGGGLPDLEIGQHDDIADCHAGKKIRIVDRTHEMYAPRQVAWVSAYQFGHMTLDIESKIDAVVRACGDLLIKRRVDRPISQERPDIMVEWLVWLNFVWVSAAKYQ